jgi:hypothetical protein
MSLQMASNPAHLPFDAKDTKTTLDDILKILRQAGLTTRELAGTDVGEPDCDGRCTLSVSLRRELLTIAAVELRAIRRQLALWRVVRDTLMHRDERAIWLPHWRARHRQAFRDGVCVAELLVAVRLKFVERELGEAVGRAGPGPLAAVAVLHGVLAGRVQRGMHVRGVRGHGARDRSQGGDGPGARH